MKTYHVTTFGCQMNEHDSERMKGMLESIGYSEADTRDDADLILARIEQMADGKVPVLVCWESAHHINAGHGFK